GGMAERGDPHVKGKHAPDEQIPADEGRRSAAAEFVYIGDERQPEAAMAREGNRRKRIAPHERQEPGEHLRAAAEREAHRKNDRQAAVAEESCIHHTEEPGGGGEGGEPERRGIGEFTFHSFILTIVIHSLRSCTALLSGGT